MPQIPQSRTSLVRILLPDPSDLPCYCCNHIKTRGFTSGSSLFDLQVFSNRIVRFRSVFIGSIFFRFFLDEFLELVLFLREEVHADDRDVENSRIVVEFREEGFLLAIHALDERVEFGSGFRDHSESGDDVLDLVLLVREHRSRVDNVFGSGLSDYGLRSVTVFVLGVLHSEDLVERAFLREVLLQRCGIDRFVLFLEVRLDDRVRYRKLVRHYLAVVREVRSVDNVPERHVHVELRNAFALGFERLEYAGDLEHDFEFLLVSFESDGLQLRHGGLAFVNLTCRFSDRLDCLDHFSWRKVLIWMLAFSIFFTSPISIPNFRASSAIRTLRWNTCSNPGRNSFR